MHDMKSNPTLVLATLALAAAFVTPVAAQTAAADPWPEIRTTAPVAKRFTAVSHYGYRERLYQPPVKPTPLTAPAVTHGRAEDVLRAQIGAALTNRYDGWLETWDETSRAVLASSAQPPYGEERFRAWKDRLTGGELELVAWLQTGQYVVLSYRIQTSTDAEAATDAEEFALAFGVGSEGWQATLDLDDDPVVLFHTAARGQDNYEVERVVR